MNQSQQRQAAPFDGSQHRAAGVGGLDPAALARAEAALKGLANNFDQWIQDELAKLKAARERIDQEGYTAKTAEGLYFRTHDLKGLGTPYGYPAVSRLAAALCRLTYNPATRLQTPLWLIDAHLKAIEAAVQNRKGDNDRAAEAAESELDAAMSQWLGGAS